MAGDRLFRLDKNCTPSSSECNSDSAPGRRPRRANSVSFDAYNDLIDLREKKKGKKKGKGNVSWGHRCITQERGGTKVHRYTGRTTGNGSPMITEFVASFVGCIRWLRGCHGSCDGSRSRSSLIRIWGGKRALDRAGHGGQGTGLG